MINLSLPLEVHECTCSSQAYVCTFLKKTNWKLTLKINQSVELKKSYFSKCFDLNSLEGTVQENRSLFTMAVKILFISINYHRKNNTYLTLWHLWTSVFVNMMEADTEMQATRTVIGPIESMKGQTGCSSTRIPVANAVFTVMFVWSCWPPCRHAAYLLSLVQRHSCELVCF